MPKITFHIQGCPTAQTVDATSGESLLEVAQRASVPMEHTCGGIASCGTCHIKVKEGERGLSPINSDEKTVLRFDKTANEKSRLACQAKVVSDVSVEVVNASAKKAA